MSVYEYFLCGLRELIQYMPNILAVFAFPKEIKICKTVFVSVF